MPGAPVLLVVDDDLRARGVVEGELRKRYGADYQVICVGSADDPPGLLARLRDGQRRVAIVLAGESVSQAAGTELLARVREFHSTARRLLLIEGGYGPPPEPILQAIALGHIDAYAGRPAMVPDEEFHLAVTELLEEWARSNLPRPEVMRVVGQEWSARSHEIRDLLSRNVVPFGFYPAGAGPGRHCWNRPAPPRRRRVVVGLGAIGSPERGNPLCGEPPPVDVLSARSRIICGGYPTRPANAATTWLPGAATRGFGAPAGRLTNPAGGQPIRPLRTG